MHDYAVNHFPRGQHQETVEIEVAFGAAAAPAAALGADGDAAVGNTKFCRIIAHAVRDQELRFLFQLIHFLLG